MCRLYISIFLFLLGFFVWPEYVVGCQVLGILVGHLYRHDGFPTLLGLIERVGPRIRLADERAEHVDVGVAFSGFPPDDVPLCHDSCSYASMVTLIALGLSSVRTPSIFK